MPEGPEVRRFADVVSAAIVGKPIVALTTRTRKALSWLAEHPGVLSGRRVE
jgi:formamidopyrimidine-DNA glycosylase